MKGSIVTKHYSFIPTITLERREINNLFGHKLKNTMVTRTYNKMIHD